MARAIRPAGQATRVTAHPARQAVRAIDWKIRGGLAVGPVLLLLALVPACGSPAATGTSTASLTSIQAGCQQVAAVLSNGPDPGADPVGYAEAQILPLRQLQTPDQALQAAISDLAAAYQGFYNAGGHGDAAKAAVTSAAKKINSLCPGAAS